jgi:superfamily I DNA/RNA helicase
MDLDEEQRKVVDSEQSLCVVAGPGSGKTRVLTEKARKLFNEGHGILCLTFTRAAAREMSERVPGIPAATIHSYCCGLVGWREEWGYTGLLYRALIEREKPQFDWILVDEVQDLNEMELDVVLSLVGDRIFAVGDPYQSIYGFQGALGPRIIKLLEAVGCREVALHSNYRSSPKVVSKLNEIFSRRLVSKGVKDTGLTFILCRTNDDVFYVSSHLRNNLIPHRLRLSAEGSDIKERDVLGPSNLRVMTIHQSKGLEADRVILFSWSPDLDYSWDGEEERLYYVAAARASKEFIEVGTLEELKEVC